MDAFDQRNYLSDKQIVRLKATVQGAPGALTVTTISESAAAFFSTQPAVLVGDLPIAVIKPTFQSNIAIVGARVNAAADLRVWWACVVANTPTASEVYDVIVAR